MCVAPHPPAATGPAQTCTVIGLALPPKEVHLSSQTAFQISTLDLVFADLVVRLLGGDFFGLMLFEAC